jgi:hypothetical protein
MIRTNLTLVAATLALMYGVPQVRASSEFPIATTSGREFGLMAAFDGTNYLVGIQGDETHHSSVTAQLVSQTGALIGVRISTGRRGGTPSVAFDGANYLLVWEDDVVGPDSDIYGQFISTIGVTVGPAFSISEAPGRQGDDPVRIVFGTTDYLVVWTDCRHCAGDRSPRYVYGQRVSKHGGLVGGEIKISAEPGCCPDVAFDGTNFLAVWVEDTEKTDYYGQFVSQSGSLVGQNFIIEGNGFESDYFTVVLFDGTRYIVTIQDQIAADEQGYYVRFVDKDGEVSAARITLYEGQTVTGCYVSASDGTDYLALLSEGSEGLAITVKGRFYDGAFSAADDWFTIFEARDSKVPVAPYAIFGDEEYLAVAARVRLNGYDDWFRDGDVYGAFINPRHPACTRDIPGDIDGDCRVDFEDFRIMAAHWLDDSSP